MITKINCCILFLGIFCNFIAAKYTFNNKEISQIKDTYFKKNYNLYKAIKSNKKYSINKLIFKYNFEDNPLLLALTSRFNNHEYLNNSYDKKAINFFLNLLDYKQLEDYFQKNINLKLHYKNLGLVLKSLLENNLYKILEIILKTNKINANFIIKSKTETCYEKKAYINLNFSVNIRKKFTIGIEKEPMLVYASRLKNKKIIQLLLKHKPTSNIIGKSLLTVSCHNNFSDIIKLLLKNNLNIKAKYLKESLIAACDAKSYKNVKLLLKYNIDLNKKYNYNRNPLIAACQTGSIEIVKLLLEYNLDTNLSANIFGTALITAIDNNHIEIVKLLLNNNIDINAKDDYNRTPLIAACQTGSIEIVKLLLKYNPDIDVVEKYWGRTALTTAIHFNNIKIIKTLLKHNAILI